MPPVVIEARNVSKKYHISSLHPKRLTAKEFLSNMAALPLRRLNSTMRGIQPTDADQEFWALKNVSFDVYQGETLGIIGTNGSGKSTLLRLIASIAHPTQGYIRTIGRIGTLMEIGSGFNPELSGRENIYINAAVLGMTRREVQENFDAILNFAEIHEFIDTPIKRYSTGMMTRLAFSVAVHLKPEILIIDEVLAVGDAAFIEKSLNKIKEIVRSGTTVILVSHLMFFITDLCDRVLWLDRGNLVQIGDVEPITTLYLDTIMPDRREKGTLLASEAPPAPLPDQTIQHHHAAPEPTQNPDEYREPLLASITALYPHDAFAITQLDGTILTVNPSFSELTEHAVADFDGMALAKLENQEMIQAVETVSVTKKEVAARIILFGKEFYVRVRPLYAPAVPPEQDLIGTVMLLYPACVFATFPANLQARLQIRQVELILPASDDREQDIQFQCTYDVRENLQELWLCVEARNQADISVFYSNDDFLRAPQKRQIGTHRVALTIPSHLFSAGFYRISFRFWGPAYGEAEDFPKTQLTFVIPEREHGLSRHNIPWPAVIYQPAQWKYVTSIESFQPDTPSYATPLESMARDRDVSA